MVAASSVLVRAPAPETKRLLGRSANPHGTLVKSGWVCTRTASSAALACLVESVISSRVLRASRNVSRASQSVPMAVPSVAHADRSTIKMLAELSVMPLLASRVRRMADALPAASGT
jgi:hypothetical protein